MAKKKDADKRELLEIVIDLSEATIDDQLLVKNVVILGHESKNAQGKVFRRYSDACLAKAVSLFEGMNAYADHEGTGKPGAHRSIKDLFGNYKNVYVDLQEHKLRGDLQIFPTSLGQDVAKIIRTNPEAVGNSICAGGRTHMLGGVEIVEEIYSRTPIGIKASIDLVGDPATTKSLFESRNINSNSNKESHNMDLADITLTELREARPDLHSKLLEEGKAMKADEAVKLTEQVTGLTAQVKTLTDEKAAVTAELDTVKVKEQIAAQHLKVDTLLTEAKLPAAAVTKVFKDSLYSLEARTEGDKTITVEEQVKNLIDDRKIALGLGGVHSNGGGGTPLKEGTKLTAAQVLSELTAAAS